MPDTTALAGDTISIPIAVINEISISDSIISFLISVTFDSTVLSPVSLIDGSLVDTSQISSNMPSGRIFLAFAVSGSGSNPPLSGTGTLISIKFYVKPDASVGSETALTFSSVTFNGQDYTSSCTSGEVSITGVIPVELADFHADLSENSVVLYWKTYSETNNAGFEIQRSEGDASFRKTGFVTGNGTTVKAHNYIWEDKNIGYGATYCYRLKQIDYDGTYSFSMTVPVTVPVPDGYVLYQNFPNPFNQGTAIRYEIPAASTVRIEIYNTPGQLMKVLVNKEKQPGSYTVIWNGDDNTGQPVVSGIYFCKFIALWDGSVSHQSVKRLTIIK